MSKKPQGEPASPSKPAARSRRSFIRSRRSRRARAGSPELPLTSMMDMLVIIVVFLLKSYSASTNHFSTVPGMKLPISASQDIPPDSLQVIITPEGVLFDNERLLDFMVNASAAGTGAESADYAFQEKDLDEDGMRVKPLYDALVKAREKAELLRARSAARDEAGNPLPFDGVLAIQADSRYRKGQSYLRPFEGILPILERQLRDASGESMRQKLEKFLELVPCASCHGLRLKPEALAVRVGPYRIHELTSTSVGALATMVIGSKSRTTS